MNNLVSIEPKKGDLARRVLRDPGWCDEEGPDGTWLGDVLMDGFQTGLVMTDSWSGVSGGNFVKMLVDSRILVVDIDTIEVVSCVRPHRSVV